jgi:hypothetical protein
VFEQDVTFSNVWVGNCVIRFLLVMMFEGNDLSQLILNFALHHAFINSPRKSGRTETKGNKLAASI